MRRQRERAEHHRDEYDVFSDLNHLDRVFDGFAPERLREVRRARDRLSAVTKSMRWSEVARATEARSGHSGELARGGYEWVVDDLSEHNDTGYWTDSGSGEWHKKQDEQKEAEAKVAEFVEKHEAELEAYEQVTGESATDLLGIPGPGSTT